MTNSYPERLAKWVKRRTSSKPRSRVAAFLAVRDDVKAALDAGFPVKTIWMEMHESQCVNVSYDTFIAYVNRYINGPPISKPVIKESTPTVVERENDAIPSRRNAAHAIGTPPQPVAGFKFNPDPKKEDLI